MTDSAQLRVVLVTDLVDSTRIVAELGDAAAHHLMLSHDRLARDLLHQHQGLEIDKSDGFLLLFDQAAPAVLFALAYHEALKEFSAQSGVQWRARVGLHRGDVFLHDNSEEDIARGAKPIEVDGLAKPIAARLMGLAQGGQTLLSAGVFNLARNDEAIAEGRQLSWLAHGRYRLKGLEEPVPVYEVGVQEQAPLCRPPDSDKAYREVTEDELQLLGWRPGPRLTIPERPDWQLLRKLGSGGFGEVWLAEHSVSRELRVFKFCHDAERLRSLKREVTVFRLIRDALGDRSDIARIIDWQLMRAPFFLELEYIEGGDLLAWSARQGGLDQLPLEVRIELVAQLADAIAAAHSVGVLHKDLKPANVLIASDESQNPRVVLTDFGIGLVTDKSQLLARGITMAGFTELVQADPTAGSQLYMAPELLEAKPASIQADLYALGVILYEVSAGEFKPLAPGWNRDIDDELLAADIAALVDGDPSRRPASAARVARELRDLPERRRRLAAERHAVREAEATRKALLRAQARRRWALALAASLALVSLLVGYSARQASLARDEAEMRGQQAERLLGFVLSDLRERLQQVGRLDVLDAVGDAALTYFSSVPAEHLNDSELSQRAKALYQIGEVRLAQGDMERAAAAMQESLTLSTALAARAPTDAQRQFDLAQSEYWSGLVAFRQRQFDRALAHFENYRRIAEWLVTQDPGHADWQQELRYALSNLGSVQEAQGALEAAIGNYQAVLDDQLRLWSQSPQSIADAVQLGTAHNKLARALEKNRQLARAKKHYLEELRLTRQALQQNPANAQTRYRLAVVGHYLVRLMDQLGELDAALADQVGVESELRALTQLDPENSAWRRGLAGSLELGARLFMQRGDWAEVSRRLQEAARLAERLGERDPLQRLRLMVVRAQFHAQREEWSAAEQQAAAVLAQLQTVGGDAPSAEIAAEAEYWRGIAAGDRPALAARYFLASLEHVQNAGDDSPRLDDLKVRALLAAGRRDQALPIAQALAQGGYRRAEFVAACTQHSLALPPAAAETGSMSTTP